MNIHTGKQAQKEMMKGIKVATDAIRLTYGPGGMNAVVQNEFYPFHQIANDAQTIIQAIQLTDPIQKRGLAFLKELSDKAHKDSGDGKGFMKFDKAIMNTYTDETPLPAAGVAVLWRYKFVYLYGGVEVGTASYIIEVMVTGM